MNLPFDVEEIKRRFIPTKEESVLVVLSFDINNDVGGNFDEASEFIVNEIGFSSDYLPSNTFVKIVMANRASSEKLVEYYRRRLREFLDNRGLIGSIFIVCGERWASNISTSA